MSVVEPQPVAIASEAPAAPAQTVAETVPAPAVESTEAPDASTTATVAPAAASTETPLESTTEAPAQTIAEPSLQVENVEEPKEEKTVEPIYSGSLSYAAHHSGLDIKSLIMGPKKRFFWFGNETPITTQNLNNYLRGEKPKVAHPVAAWSNKTGKGLLYFSKQAEDKSNPNGVLLLADATDFNDTHGPNEFSFKLDGTKHIFTAKSTEERAGWVAALKKVHEEAREQKEEITTSTEYKDSLAALAKPVATGLAVAGATGAAAKKSTEVSKENDKPVADAPVTEAAETTKPVEEPKKRDPKSRSVSRGKRTSIFGSIMGKKDEVEEKLEAKKEEKKAEKEEKKVEEEAKKEEPAAAAAPAITVAEPTVPETETKTVEPALAVHQETPATETKTAEGTDAAKAKANKRGSVFGRLFEKVNNPNQEVVTKETEVTSATPAKDETANKDLPAAATATAPVIEEPAKTEPITIPGAGQEAKKEEKSPSGTPKESFFGKLTQKLRSPSSEATPTLAKEEKTEIAPTTEAPVTTSTAPSTEAAAPAPATSGAAPADSAVLPLTEEPVPNGVGAEASTAPPAVAPATKPAEPEKRRSSFFGSGFGSGKKDKPTSGDESEGSGKKLSGLFRNPSKLIKSQKEGKKANAPTKVDEETKVSDEAPKLDAPEQSEPLSEEAKPEEKPTQIGDVVPEAVQVGQPPAAAPTVSATA